MKITKNDLYDYDLKIYQDEEAFKFSLDSILLAEFVELQKKPKVIVDFCTGNGAIPLILSTKTNAHIEAFEYQKTPYELAIKSVKENNLEKQINVINDNLNIASDIFEVESVDIVTCNPPYFKYQQSSYININQEKAIARHEITTNLEEIVITAKKILINNGYFYLVHRPERLSEIIILLNNNKLTVKKLQFIYTKEDKPAIMVLIKAVKNGLEGLEVSKPINITNYSSYKNIFD